MLKSLSKTIFRLIPAKSPMLLRAAQRYVDRFNGDNDSNSSTNGEEWLLNKELPKLRGGGVVFDVGANIGNWSRYCLGVAPDLRMHLFEPSAFTFKKLQSSEWPTGVKLNNLGLGERQEQLLLNIAGDGAGMNSIHQRHGVKGVEMAAGVSTEAIQIQTLDAYCEENGIIHIDFLKVDVEGHEMAVFKGASNMLSNQKIDLIQFEYGGCNLDARVYLLDIWNLLQSYGYVIGKIYPNRIEMLGKYQQCQETFRYANFIAKRK